MAKKKTKKELTETLSALDKKCDNMLSHIDEALIKLRQMFDKRKK